MQTSCEQPGCLLLGNGARPAAFRTRLATGVAKMRLRTLPAQSEQIFHSGRYKVPRIVLRMPSPCGSFF